MPSRPNFPIPEDINADKFCLCIQVPNEPTWKHVVAGLLYELQYWYNWQRDDANSGKLCAAVWKETYNAIDWSTMSCCCQNQAPAQFRWTIEGELEISIDSGVTWTPAPEFDPRNNSPQFPPVPGDPSPDKKCIAATGAATLLKEQVGDNITDDMTHYTLGQLIADWVHTMVETSNPFTALITVIANQIFALVLSALSAALTDDVYTLFKCILDCRMADDISFDNSAWEGVRSDITDQISGIAGVFLEHIVFLLGVVGLTNLVRSSGAASGDCSDCACPGECDFNLWDYYDVDAGTTITKSAGSWTITSDDRGGGEFYVIILSDNDDTCCNLVLGPTTLWDEAFYIPCGTARAGIVSGVGRLTLTGTPSDPANALMLINHSNTFDVPVTRSP